MTTQGCDSYTVYNALNLEKNNNINVGFIKDSNYERIEHSIVDIIRKPIETKYTYISINNIAIRKKIVSNGTILIVVRNSDDAERWKNICDKNDITYSLIINGLRKIRELNTVAIIGVYELNCFTRNNKRICFERVIYDLHAMCRWGMSTYFSPIKTLFTWVISSNIPDITECKYHIPIKIIKKKYSDLCSIYIILYTLHQYHQTSKECIIDVNNIGSG